MNIALCYENGNRARGGCETYIADLARRLVADGHAVHLYACRWNADALPDALHYQRLDVAPGPRFLRPWRLGAAPPAGFKRHHHHLGVRVDKHLGPDGPDPPSGPPAAAAGPN